MPEAILAADHVVDLGPGAGVHGGKIVAQGTPEEIKADPASLTGQYLAGRSPDPATSATRRTFDASDRAQCPRSPRQQSEGQVDVDVPLGLMTCVTGVSGSGKSTLINDTLCPTHRGESQQDQL